MIRYRFLFLTVSLATFAAPALAQRESIELAAGWKFIRQDVGAQTSVDSWETVTLPHTWNARDAQDGPAPGSDLKLGQHRGDYFRGACWYARALDIPVAWKGKRVFLLFEAASLIAKPFINGQPLAEHRGAFTAFSYEITSEVNYWQPNELRVRVDNSRVQDVPPLSGDFNVFGGIYRPVRLIVTDPVCITPLHYASPGVYLTLRSLRDNEAFVEVKTLVANGLDAPAGVEIVTEIKDAGGQSVATKKNALTISAGREPQPILQLLQIANPHRWNALKDPYLYSAVVRVLRDGKVVDEVVQPLGLRTVEMTQDGLILNGAPYPIYGINRHQDRRDKGWALSAADDEEDLRLIREMGATAIRLAHYPQSTRIHDLCDRAGFLVWDEIPFVNEPPNVVGAFDASSAAMAAFAANLDQELREMILQRYNHPSVAWWGLFNELRRTYSQGSLPMLHRLNALAHELDPARVTVAASDRAGLPSNQVPDWICYNVYPGWYNEFGDDMPKLIDERFAEQGNRRVAISEYGAGGNIAHHEPGVPKKPVTTGPFHSEEWQCLVHERDWAAMKNNPKLWGTFLWVMFDFASDWREEGGLPGINDKGMVTQDRKVRKDVYFFYQANWSTEPVLHIASRRFTPRAEAITEVKVYSNASAVELFVNGASQGIQRGADCVIRWPGVTLHSGENQIEARADFGGRRVSDACTWVLDLSKVAPVSNR